MGRALLNEKLQRALGDAAWAVHVWLGLTQTEVAKLVGPRSGLGDSQLEAPELLLGIRLLHYGLQAKNYGVSPSSRSLPRAISFSGSFWRMRR